MVKERGAKKYYATCPFRKNTKDRNYCQICGSTDHYVDKCPNKAKKKASVKLLNVDLTTRTFEYKFIFRYEVNLDDKSIYELISKYSEESKDNLSTIYDEEYSSSFYKESATLYRLNIFMNKIENLNEPFNLFYNNEELIYNTSFQIDTLDENI